MHFRQVCGFQARSWARSDRHLCSVTVLQGRGTVLLLPLSRSFVFLSVKQKVTRSVPKRIAAEDADYVALASGLVLDSVNGFLLTTEDLAGRTSSHLHGGTPGIAS